MIAIELDGDSHEDRQAYDQLRTEKLAEQGVRVLRISNDDVISNLDGVLELIARAVGVEVE